MPRAVLVRSLVTAGVALAFVCPTAAASPYQRVLTAYEHTGSLAPCQFSAATLSGALGGVDSYGAQYFADFTQAVNNALSARAAGACRASTRPHRGAASSSGGPPGPSGPGVGIPAHMASLTAPTGGGVPAPLLLLGALALVAAVGVSAALLLRARRR